VSPYAGLGALTLVVGALGGLVWFASRAGRNAASVSDTRASVAEANDVTRITQAMATVAGADISDADMLTRLAKGQG